MDRSLKFFLGNLNKLNNVDRATGLPLDTHEVQTSVDTDTTQQTNTNTFIVTTSLQGENIVNYSGNSPINSIESYISQPEEQSDISLSSIINWSQKNHPALALKPEYFVYLKYFRSYPANRLMILRRFSDPAPHDLFNSKVKMKPMSTLVTYLKEDEMPVKITFKENWKKIESDHTFFEVLQDVIGVHFDSIPGVGNIINKTSQSPFAQDIFQKLAKDIGLTSTENLYGDPNIIYESHIRDVSGKEVASGLTSDIAITFESDYVLNEINGVDAKAGLMDIIANIIKMGTSPEKFYLSGDGAEALRGLIKDFENGDGGAMIGKIVDFFSDVLTSALDTIKTTIAGGETNTGEVKGANQALINITGVSDIVSKNLKRRYARYKWQLTGLMGNMAGSATAPWHITIGNPKSPWFACGNLVIDNVELTPNSTLGYSDFFTELNVKITLKAARSMGSSGLTSLFNNGKGRIYDNPDNIKQKNIEKNDVVLGPDEIVTGTVDKQPEETNDGTNNNIIPNITDFSTNEEFDDPNLQVV
jgi:hypothetical protein